MYHQNILPVILALASQLLSVATHHAHGSHESHEEHECVGPILESKFQSFYFQPDQELEGLHAQHSGSSFFAQAETELSDLAVTYNSKEIQLKGTGSHLHDEHPCFDVEFVYRGSLTVVGTHSTSGVILAKKPFSGLGIFNFSIEFEAHFETHMLNLEPTPSGYLKTDSIHTRIDKPESTNWDFTDFYIENISDNEAIAEHLESIGTVVFGALDSLRNKTLSEVGVQVDNFWQQEIPQINLTDVCVTI